MIKKGFAVLLAAALIAALIPVTALADELPAEEPAGEEAVLEEAAESEEAVPETAESEELPEEAAESEELAEEAADPLDFDWPSEPDEALSEESEPASLNGATDIKNATYSGLKPIYRMDLPNLFISNSNKPTIEGVDYDKFKPAVKLYYNGKQLTEGKDYELSTGNMTGPTTIRFTATGKGSYSGEKYLTTAIAMGITIAGKNRYATNVDLVKTSDALNSPGKNWSRIVVVTGEDFPDALAANAYAGIRNSPLLLSKRDHLPAPISDCIKTHTSEIEEVVVIGGKMNGAVKDLKTIVPSAKYTTIAGSNRYQTADAVTRQFLLEMYDVPLNDNKTKVDCPVFVTTGQSPADALSASSWSYTFSIPVLLVKDGTFNKKSDTKNVIKHFKTVYLLGDAKVTKDSIVPSGATKVRIGGKNRWETSRKISDFFKDKLTQTPPPITLYVPSDDDLFADALAAGQLMTVGAGYAASIILVNEKHPAPYSIAENNPQYKGMSNNLKYMYNMFVGSAGKGKGKIYDAVMKKLEDILKVKG